MDIVTLQAARTAAKKDGDLSYDKVTLRPSGDTTGAKDTAALTTAVTAGGRIQLAAGTYYINNTLTPVANTTIIGATQRSTILRYTKTDGTLFNLINGGVKFSDLSVNLPDVTSTATAFYVSNVFRCSWNKVWIQGGHTVGTPQVGTTGVQLRDNAGDNRFTDCDFVNLGSAIRTSAIQNYVTGCVFGNNKYGVYGDSGSVNAGISIVNSTFTAAVGAVTAHIYCPVSASVWWITNTWFEGCDTAVLIGSNDGTAGPASFGMISCKVAATTACIVLNNAKMPVLENIWFGADAGATPIEVSINATGAPSGTAINLVSAQVFEIPATVFPGDWTYLSRSTLIKRSAAATSVAYASYMPGESFPRFTVLGDGSLNIGPGTSATDTKIQRTAANVLQTVTMSIGSGNRIAGSTFSSTGNTGQVAIAARPSASGTSDILNVNTSGGTVKAGFLNGGTFISEDAAQGIILKDSANTYWRVTVNTSGQLITTGLGTTRPTA